MKTLKKILLLSAIALVTGIYTADAQVYVKQKPGKPDKIKVKGDAHPGEVWIDEDWQPKESTYVWNGERWERVPKPDMQWVAGYWVEKQRGWVWVPGHWEERKG
ncbi:MAG: YXWGXW repeat-containing protein [Bacteroidota bacterium]